MFENLKSKAVALILAPVAAVTSASAFAGDLSSAAADAVSKITGAIPETVLILGGMMSFAVVVWAGRRAVGLFGR